MVSQNLKSEAKNDKNFAGRGDKFEMAARIDEAIRAAGGPSMVSKKSGVPRKTLFNYSTGARDARALTLGQVAQACGVSLDWLILGQGQKQAGQATRSAVDKRHLATAIQAVDELESGRNLSFSADQKADLILITYDSVSSKK